MKEEDMPPEKMKAKIQEMLTYAGRLNKKRGELINDTIELEVSIEVFITFYFCKDESKRKALLALTIRKLNLDKKIEIYESLRNKINYQKSHLNSLILFLT